MAVQAVPQGYSTVTPYLTIKGCAEAMDFYQKAFGAVDLGRMLGPNGAIMHAEMQLGTSRIMFSEPMQMPETQSSCFLYVEDCDAAWKRAMDAGCEVVVPIADQPWGDRYGLLRDKWGNRWAIATHKEDVAPEEMKRRMDEMMKSMK